MAVGEEEGELVWPIGIKIINLEVTAKRIEHTVYSVREKVLASILLHGRFGPPFLVIGPWPFWPRGDSSGNKSIHAVLARIFVLKLK